MYRVALSTNAKTVNEALFVACRAAGIAGMELTGDVSAMDREAVVRWARRHDVRLWSYHIPFAPFDCIDPSFLDEEKRLATVAEQGALIRLAGEMGIRRYVIHTSKPDLGMRG